MTASFFSHRRRLAFLSSLLTVASAFHLPTSSFHHRSAAASLSVGALHQYAIDTSESATRDTTTLTEWAINYGNIGLADSFSLTSSALQDNYNAASNEEDIYAIATQNIPTSTPILSIPSNVILTGSNARTELGSQTYGAESSLPLSDHQHFYLFLKILAEYELVDQSPWYYWLNSLPRYYSNGASMTDFCFGCLPPYAAGLALKEKKRYRQYVEVLGSIPFLSDATKQSEEVTKWAFNVVFTRCVELPGGDMALVPMVDYLNHGAEPNVDISYDGEGNCYVYSMRDVGAGEPLVFSYGDSTNPSNLLARYGFLDESRSATFCKYVIENPTGEMFDLGYPSSMYFYNDGSISNEVWDVLLYELLKVSPEEQQYFYQAHVSGDEGTKASYHNQYFAQTYKSITSHVDYILNELEELGIGLETQIAQGQDKTRHPRLPLIQRHNAFVKAYFDNVRQNLDNMYA